MLFLLTKIQCNLNKQFYNSPNDLVLESGEVLKKPTVAYNTYGSLSDKKDNVVWIFHALTAASNVDEWWDGLVGEGKLFDPKKYFIVCANMLGSCYGSSGPNSINPDTGKAYNHSFPAVTIRDIINSQIELKNHLKIDKIKMAVGGSCGGYQALEWLLMEPKTIEHYTICVTSPKESAWGIAVHTAHRTAIELDPSWGDDDTNSGLDGMKAARQIGLLFYRNHEIYHQNQTEKTNEKLKEFSATSYLKYQGEKLAKRFSPISYYKLTEVLDTHNIARGRDKDIKDTLKRITQKGLVVSISSDLLCPPTEQQFMAKHLPNSQYALIDSLYGHDGFLLEYTKIGNVIKEAFPELNL